jgi:hypothetical protein
MILPRNNPRTIFGETAVVLAQTKGYNRAVHSGEKSIRESYWSKFSERKSAGKCDRRSVQQAGKAAHNSNSTRPMR